MGMNILSMTKVKHYLDGIVIDIMVDSGEYDEN